LGCECTHEGYPPVDTAVCVAGADTASETENAGARIEDLGSAARSSDDPGLALGHGVGPDIWSECKGTQERKRPMVSKPERKEWRAALFGNGSGATADVPVVFCSHRERAARALIYSTRKYVRCRWLSLAGAAMRN
jgi:hypothetical protein